jgi:Type ISP C-terminal specificity domain/N-6 DNA Methylase
MSAKLARQLADALLSQCASIPETHRISSAFDAFLTRHEAGDGQATQVAAQLAMLMHAPDGRPYFLEHLQYVADGEARRRRGVFYTPYPVVQYLTQAALSVFPHERCTIIDPACGAGLFLTAAHGYTQRTSSRLLGFDVCPTAVQVAKKLVPEAHMQCVNPLIAGEELAAELLSENQPLIVLGNPPYANYGRLNQSPWLQKLMADYRVGLHERKSNLGDDFIKFIRWGQYWIERAGRGVLAFVTSRTYLDGLTHRSMRRSLLSTFQQIRIVDLHGDQASGDENIFAIRRGVCVAFLVKDAEGNSGVEYTELRGTRAKKLQALQEPLSYQSLEPQSPHFSFLPSPRTIPTNAGEYASWPSLPEIFREYVSGVQTKNDALFVDFDRATLALRMQQALASEINVRWPRTLRELPPFEEAKIRPYLVAPGDVRWIYYDARLLGRARYATLRHLLHPQNVALIFMRQTAGVHGFSHAWATNSLASDRVFYSRRGAPFLAPLFLADDEPEQVNFQSEWLETLQTMSACACSPCAALGYIYGWLHQPRYRHQYAAELASDYPHIPWPRSPEEFQAFAQVGEQLLRLHTETQRSSVPLSWHGQGNIALGYPRYDLGKCWLNRHAWIEGIEPTSWHFQAGGYAMLKQRLKARQGRQLFNDDLLAFEHCYGQITKTIKLVQILDAFKNRS